MKGKYILVLLFPILIMANLSTSVQGLTASTEWCCSVGDEYYVIWSQHPVLTNLQLLIPTNDVYEKVKVEYIGSALAAHEHPPTTSFDHSINVTGAIWNGASWLDVAPYDQQTQLTLWESPSTWFCGGLYSGVPVIAPTALSQNDRKNTNVVNTGILWTGITTVTEDTGVTPARWTYTNGTYSLIVGYESDGFLQYYRYSDGVNIYECTCQTTVPELPTAEIPGFSIEIIGMVAVIAIVFIVMKMKFTTKAN